jgi:hypothetical protein
MPLEESTSLNGAPPDMTLPTFTEIEPSSPRTMGYISSERGAGPKTFTPVSL